MLRKELKGNRGSSVRGDSVYRRVSVQIRAEVIRGRSLRLEVAWLVFEARSGFDCVGAKWLPTCSCPPQPQGQWCSLFVHGRWSDYVSVSCSGVSAVLCSLELVH